MGEGGFPALFKVEAANDGSGAEREKGSERVTLAWRASLLQAGSYSSYYTRRQARKI